MNLPKNNVIYLTAAVVLLAVVIICVYWYMQGQSLSYLYSNTQDTQNNSDTQNNTSTAGKLSYTSAVNLYKDKRIQFDANCVASPSPASFNKGTKIMLDNRSNKQRRIALDGAVYNLAPYDYKIVTLTTTSSLPHTIMIDCGTGQNNGQIILQ